MSRATNLLEDVLELFQKRHVNPVEAAAALTGLLAVALDRMEPEQRFEVIKNMSNVLSQGKTTYEIIPRN